MFSRIGDDSSYPTDPCQGFPGRIWKLTTNSHFWLLKTIFDRFLAVKKFEFWPTETRWFQYRAKVKKKRFFFEKNPKIVKTSK